MSTTDLLPTPCADGASSRRFHLSVDDETLRHALTYVGTGAGWSAVRVPGATTCIVHDRPRAVTRSERIGRRNILVVPPTPAGARGALDAVTGGLAMAVFSSDRPGDLVVALESVVADRAMIPGGLMELAADMPELTERQLAVVSAVISGQSNREIGRGLYLSDASVKRELSELFRALDVTNRLALAARGTELGITARRLTA